MTGIDRSRGSEALAFLVEQRLDPTPENYTLAYIALTDPESPIGRMVTAITADGFRLRQEEADQIVRVHASGVVPGSAGTEPAAHDALRHQAIKLGETATSAAAASGAFARELSAEADGFDGTQAHTVQIVARMIERSRTAEIDLNEAASEVAALRLDWRPPATTPNATN